MAGHNRPKDGGHADDGAPDCGRSDCRQGTSGDPQADLQAAILVALRKRNGATVIGEGAPARRKSSSL
jgi:hypothetical protein